MATEWKILFLKFFIYLIFNGLFIFTIYRSNKQLKRSVYSFFMVGIVVFFLCATLKNFDLNIGMALGLFALFGIIRYRTEPVRHEEITYLFVTIGISAINALTSDQTPLLGTIIINLIILLAVIFAEKYFLFSKENEIQTVDSSGMESTQKIVLNIPLSDNMENQISKKTADIEAKLNCKVIRHTINKIDYELNKVQITAYYVPASS